MGFIPEGDFILVLYFYLFMMCFYLNMDSLICKKQVDILVTVKKVTELWM